MYSYVIWNKKDSINGVPAEEILKDFDVSCDIILIKKNGIVEIINDVDTLRTYRKLPIDSTSIEVAEDYIKSCINNALIIEMNEKISILEGENKQLKAKLTTVEATHSDMILEIDFRVMDIEDALGTPINTKKIFNKIGEDNMNSTFIVVLSKIEDGRYKDKTEIESICERYLDRERITLDEYDALMRALDKKEVEKNIVTEV